MALLLSAHVDDLKATGEPEWIEWLFVKLTEQFGKLVVKKGEFEHCGLRPINLTDIDCSDETILASPELVKLYQALLGGLSWLTQNRVDVCVYVEALQRASHAPNLSHLLRINRVTRWVR